MDPFDRFATASNVAAGMTPEQAARVTANTYGEATMTNETTTYYAVCNANGPISKRIEHPEVEPQRAWIDGACTDAEDDLDIAGEGMSAEEFQEALIEAGATLVRDNEIADDWQVFAINHA